MNVPAGTRLPYETYEALRWLAYKRHTTVSAIIAEYVERCLAGEDLTRFVLPEPRPT
jgi:predicted DNA-binding protein